MVRGSEKLNELPEATQPVSGGAGIRIELPDAHYSSCSRVPVCFLVDDTQLYGSGVTASPWTVLTVGQALF